MNPQEWAGLTTQSETAMDEHNIVPQTQPGEDIMEVLAEFESGLDSLKALYSQRQRLQTRIRQHEDAVSAREAAVTQRAAEVEQGAKEYQARRQQLEEGQARVTAREGELAARAEELTAERAAIEEARIAVNAARSGSEAQARERHETLNARTQELEAIAREMECQREDLNRQSQVLNAARADFEREREAKVATELAQVESLQQSLAAEREKLASALEQGRALEARVTELNTQLNDARTQAQALAATREKTDAKAAADRAALVEKVKECEQALAAGAGERAALTEKFAQRDRAATEAEQRGEALAAQLEQLERTLQAQGKAAEQRADEFARLTDRAAEFERRLSQEQEESARLNASLSEHQAAGARLEEVVEALKGKLRLELDEREEMRHQLEAAQAGLMQTSARTAQLEEELARTSTELADLRQQARARKNRPVSSSSAAMLRRQQRLKKAHALIRQQSSKLRMASEAMRKRISQCEQVMAQRAELASVRDRVIMAERKTLQKQAGGKAAMITLCAVAVFAVLAALSWAAARELAPATYMASSMLQANGRGRQLNESEKMEWQNFHQGLLEDPRFHETVADRYKKQGVVTLSSASAVAEMIHADVTLETPEPGQLVVHMKGQGSDRTQRSLETFTAAFTSHANAAQQQRVDGGVTEVKQSASVGAEPLDNTREVWAGGFLAGTVLLGAFLWGFLWQRLAGAKTAFEQDPAMMAALDDSKWAAFATVGAAEQVTKNKAARG